MVAQVGGILIISLKTTIIVFALSAFTFWKVEMAREICPMCDGSGEQYDEDAHDTVKCDACDGDGFIET